VIMKYVASAKKDEIAGLLPWFVQKTILLGVGASVIFLILSPFLSSFLHISIEKVALVSLMIYFSMIVNVYKSFLQGLLRFKSVVTSTIIEVLIKLALGVLLILLGYSVFGAEIGMLVALLFGLVLTRFFLKDIRERYKNKIAKVNIHSLIGFSVPIFVYSFVNNSFLSSDVLLVKHYFSAQEAGLYGSVSTIGKIVLYASSPISSVMFPMVAKAYAKNGNYRIILMLSISMAAGLSLVLLIAYILIPEVILNLLYRKDFVEAAPLLFWVGLFVAIYTIATMLISFYFSIGRTRVVVIAIYSAAAHIIGIILFHNTLLEVLKVSIAASSLLLLSLLVYFLYDQKHAAN